ncbi:ATP-binding protein [Krasilnikovia sp. MM14-A1004]|uniref:ATP-binding protein n=1 Tax=Krasilnikovia sp. MM14-A1004 TaxID=3373541 RepID=UPI00399D1D8A
MPEHPVDSVGMTYSEPGDLSSVRAFVAEQARALGLAADRIDLLTVAVSELATNTLQHAGGGGYVRVWGDTGRVCCEVVDGGGPRSFGRAMPSAEALRGRGLALVERICDSVEMVEVPGGTLVRLCLEL